MNYKKLLTLTLGLISIGCNDIKNSSDLSGDKKQIISVSDLVPVSENIKQLSKVPEEDDNVLDKLSKSMGLYNFFDDSSNPSAESTCIEEKLKQGAKLEVSEKKILLYHKGDILRCYENASKNSVIKSFIYEYVLTLECLEGNYGRVDIEDLTKNRYTSVARMSCSKQSIQSQMVLSSSAEGSKGNATRESFIYEGLTENGLQPCILDYSKPTGVLISKCEKVTRSITKIKSPNGELSTEEDFNKVVLNSVKSRSDQDSWFYEGSADVVINNWSGTVSYMNNSSAPRYELYTQTGGVLRGLVNHRDIVDRRNSQ